MRFVRSGYGHEWYATFETRILFNPLETKLIDGVRWLVGYFWAERIVDPILLLRCRWFGKHSRACRGRRGHR